MALRDEYAGRAVAVTPNDSADLTETTRWLYVGVTGDVAVILQGDTSAVTLLNVAQGVMLPLRVKRVMATNTDATDIVALYPE